MSALAKDELIDGKYRIVRFLGKGAWASVYEGVNIRLHRRVAIKVLGKETLQHPGVVERFEREGQAATQIESDHVIDIFDIGTLEDGRPYMVMEFLDGEDLAKTFEKVGIMEPRQAVFYVVQALTGLGAAHEAGVLHRDIKPANVVLVKKQDREIVKIVDFGISKLHSGAVPQASAMTQTNAVLGSPVYMSPEQCRGARLMDHRSDLYSLGVVLYEALTGKVPHIADTFNALMFKIALEDVPDPRTHRPDLDPGLAEIILRALARDTEKRFQSAADFRAALVSWADEQGLDPASWAVGSVRNIVAASKSGASPRQKLTDSQDDGTATRVLTDSGERKAEAIAPTVPAPALTESQEREKTTKDAAPAADPTPSRSRPTEPSATRAPNRLPMIAGVAGLFVVAVIAFIALRKPDAPTDTKTGLVATSTTPSATAATPSATPTQTAEPTATTTASAAPVETTTAAASASAAPTVAGHVATGRAIATGTPRTTATPSASTAAKATASAPAASASAKAVIDGRTIHTNF